MYVPGTLRNWCWAHMQGSSSMIYGSRQTHNKAGEDQNLNTSQKPGKQFQEGTRKSKIQWNKSPRQNGKTLAHRGTRLAKTEGNTRRLFSHKGLCSVGHVLMHIVCLTLVKCMHKNIGDKTLCVSRWRHKVVSPSATECAAKGRD